MSILFFWKAERKDLPRRLFMEGQKRRVCGELVMATVGVGGRSIRLSQPTTMSRDIYQALSELRKGTWQCADGEELQRLCRTAIVFS
jgi:hypothetical protein